MACNGDRFSSDLERKVWIVRELDYETTSPDKSSGAFFLSGHVSLAWELQTCPAPVAQAANALQCIAKVDQGIQRRRLVSAIRSLPFGSHDQLEPEL